MAVALVGHVQLAWGSTPSTLTFPAGTAAGHVAIAFVDWADPAGPRQSGWRLTKWATYWRVLSAADVAAGPGVWDGRLRGMLVVSGCRGIGNTSYQRGATLSEAGAALLTEGWTDYYTDATTMGPAPDRLGNAIEGYKDQILAWWLRTGLPVGYQSVARDDDAMGYRSFELLPTAGPSAPTLIGPSGQVDATQSIGLSWVHNSSAGLPQDSYAVRVKPSSSGTWQYLTAAGALSATEVQVASSVTSLTVPAGTLSSVAWDWSVKTSDSGSWSAYASALQFTPVTPPSVVVTLTTAAGDLTPEVSAVPTTPGGSQIAWQAAIAPAGGGIAGALWTSPVTAGTGNRVAVPAQAWTNGGSYQGLWRVQQTGGLWSPWTASTAATVSWTPPAAPASVTPADGKPPTVTVAGIPASDVLELEVSPDLTEWTPLAAVDLPNATESVPNPLAPHGVGRYYRARILKATDGVLLPSAWVTSTAMTSTDRCAYLVSADNVADYLPIRLVGDATRVLAQGVTVSYGLGSTVARTSRTPTAGEIGTAVIRTDTPAIRAAVVDWVTTRSVWVMRWPAEPGTPDWTDTPPMRMSLADRVQWVRRTDVASPERRLSFDWVEA